MYNSQYRKEKQWKKIQSIINDRKDIYPFIFGKNMQITIAEEVVPVYSKRDFDKKAQEISDKHGMTEVTFGYSIDMDRLYTVVEQRLAELIGIEGATNGKNHSEKSRRNRVKTGKERRGN